VFDNDLLFKHVDYPFKLVFGVGTKVTRNDKLTDIPSHVFRFKSFKEIGEGEFKIDVLYGIFFVYVSSFFFWIIRLLIIPKRNFKKSLVSFMGLVRQQ